MPAFHKYSPHGKLLFSWGEPGTDPGQFNLVHNIACDDEGWVYVADRENHRVQVFDGNGKYEAQWHNLMRPCGLCVTRGKKPIAVIGELGPETVAVAHQGRAQSWAETFSRFQRREKLWPISALSRLARVGAVHSTHGGRAGFSRRHLCRRSREHYWPILFGTKPDHELRSLQKLVRVS